MTNSSTAELHDRIALTRREIGDIDRFRCDFQERINRDLELAERSADEGMVNSVRAFCNSALDTAEVARRS